MPSHFADGAWEIWTREQRVLPHTFGMFEEEILQRSEVHFGIGPRGAGGVFGRKIPKCWVGS